MPGRNKTKHNRTKKHKYYSNLILNQYVIENVKVIRFEDVHNPLFNEHTKKFNFFTVRITSGLYEGESPPNNKINESNYITYIIQSKNYTTYTTELANDFLHGVISAYLSHECCPEIFPGIEIVFISDPKNITQKLYLENQCFVLN